MPQTFDSFGVRFLYPDNWKQVERAEDEGKDGVTLELPSGGFFTIEKTRSGDLTEEILMELTESFESDYGEVERERIHLEGEVDGEEAFEFRFYYLDLLIVSRLVVLDRQENTLVVQMQAESRDYDENDRVFLALMQQIRGQI